MGGDGMQIAEAFTRSNNDLAAFRYDREDVMQGYANLFRSGLTESEDAITIEFRSNTQDIIDSSVTKRPGIGDVFGDTTNIGEAVSYLLEGSNVPVTYDDPATRNIEISKFKPSPEATVMAEIVRLVAEHRLTVFDPGTGGIVISDLSKREVVGVLNEDNFDYTSFVVEIDTSGLFNRYNFTNHRPDTGEDAADIGTDFFGAEDSDVSDATSFSINIVRKPLPFPRRRRVFQATIPQRLAEADVRAKANYDINRTHAQILTINTNVFSWTNPEGNLWRVGDIYRVKFDSRRVDMECMLSAVTLSHGTAQTAQLTFTDARAWIPEYTLKTGAKQTLNDVDYFQAR